MTQNAMEILEQRGYIDWCSNRDGLAALYGSEMVTALLERLRTCYMIDLVCDDDVVPFYERLGGTRLNAVAWRNHDRLGAADG